MRNIGKLPTQDVEDSGQADNGKADGHTTQATTWIAKSLHDKIKSVFKKDIDDLAQDADAAETEPEPENKSQASKKSSRRSHGISRFDDSHPKARVQIVKADGENIPLTKSSSKANHSNRKAKHRQQAIQAIVNGAAASNETLIKTLGFNGTDHGSSHHNTCMPDILSAGQISSTSIPQSIRLDFYVDFSVVSSAPILWNVTRFSTLPDRTLYLWISTIRQSDCRAIQDAEWAKWSKYSRVAADPQRSMRQSRRRSCYGIDPKDQSVSAARHSVSRRKSVGGKSDMHGEASQAGDDAMIYPLYEGQLELIRYHCIQVENQLELTSKHKGLMHLLQPDEFIIGSGEVWVDHETKTVAFNNQSGSLRCPMAHNGELIYVHTGVHALKRLTEVVHPQHACHTTLSSSTNPGLMPPDMAQGMANSLTQSLSNLPFLTTDTPKLNGLTNIPYPVPGQAGSFIRVHAWNELYAARSERQRQLECPFLNYLVIPSIELASGTSDSQNEQIVDEKKSKKSHKHQHKATKLESVSNEIYRTIFDRELKEKQAVPVDIAYLRHVLKQRHDIRCTIEPL